ncbi:MAG: DUF3783 domain-containing protein [Clostridium sp.]|uniref:DUF3783 domain-containing protein n=1 Tax=Clostridium sp. TaxID=1506 RepID=UPI003F2BFB25
MKKNKCLLAYGLTEEERMALRAFGKVIEIKPEMAELKIGQIPTHSGEGLETVKELPKEKVVLFHDFADSEARGTISKVRSTVPGVILAMVTPMSRMWSFHYLINHLMEERELHKQMQEGR